MQSKFERASTVDDLRAAEKLSKSAFLVYRTLERMAFGLGNGFRAKHETIGQRAGLSVSTVQRALRELTACNMLRIRHNARTIMGRNYRIANSYFIRKAAVWCFSERLKELAKIMRRAVRLVPRYPVSVKNDRTRENIKINTLEGVALASKYDVLEPLPVENLPRLWALLTKK